MNLQIRKNRHILIPATRFCRGRANTNEHPFGKGLIVDGGEKKSLLSWSFDCDYQGIYWLISCYASREYRPVELRLDENLLKTDALNELTGGWELPFVKRVIECEIYLSEGKHELTLKTDQCIPHLKEFQLVFKNPHHSPLDETWTERFQKKWMLKRYQRPQAGLFRKCLHHWLLYGFNHLMVKAFHSLHPSSFFQKRWADVLGIYTGSLAFTGPRLVQIDVTNFCTNECIGCWCHSPLLKEKRMSAEQKAKFLPYERISSLLQELKGMGCREIYYSGGGEPFCHPQMNDILRKTVELEMASYVNTNFTLLDEQAILSLIHLGINHLTISVWAGSPESYLATHPSKKLQDFYRLKDGITFLNANKQGIPYTKIYQVISSLNYQDLFAMADFAIETKSDSVEFTLMDPIPGKTDSLLLNALQLMELKKNALELKKRYETDLNKKIIFFNFDEFLRRLDNPSLAEKGYYDSETIKRIPCTIGWTFARINADGDVNSCLKSHRIPVGNIYHQSFSEIWNGKKQQWFREHSHQRKKNDPFFHMIGNDPKSSMGCEKTCDDLGRNRFMNDKIKAMPLFMRWILSAAALYYRSRKKTLPSENKRHLPPAIAGFMDGEKVLTGPEEVVIDLTNACSLQCLPCFIHSPLLINPPDSSWFNKKLEPGSLKQCLVHLQEMGTHRIRLTGGGDPLCYPELIPVLTSCKKLGFYTAMTTSLYKVSPSTLKGIMESGIDEISVSLMAASEKMYLKIHPKTAPQDFEKILTQIMQLTASRKIKVVLCHVIMNANYQEIADMAILAGKLNVNALYYTLMDPVDTGLSGLVLSEAERQKASVLCREVDDLRAKGLIPFLEGWDAFKSHLTAGTKKPPVDAVPCSVGWHFSRILADGTVVPCCKGVHYSVGNIHDKSFKELWKNERYTQFRIHCKNLSSSADFFNAFRCQSCDNEEHNRNFNQALKNHTDQIK